MAHTLDRLAATIATRRQAEPGSSYVASLFAKGVPTIARKLGEEAVETVIAALSGDAKATTGEAADLIFHLLVLLEAKGIALADVLAELDRREGISGLDEKAARAVPPAPPRPITVAADEPLTPSLALGREKAQRPRIRKG